MALVFPRDMISGRKWYEATFWLNQRQELSRTAGGSRLGADLGPALWRASFRSEVLRQHDADAFMADFYSLRGVLRTFYAHPVLRCNPASVRGQATPSLSSLNVRAVSADRQRIGIDGFPSGFTLTTGDYVSVRTAAGGYEFMQLAEGGSADSGGSAPMLTVTHPIRPAVDAGDDVEVTKPRIEMILEPGTLERDASQFPLFQVAFQAWQVVR